MLITTHAVLGAVLAEKFTPYQPLLAFVLGLFSHFLIDIVPHGDSDLYKGFISGSGVKRAIAYVGLDIIGALAWIIWLANGHVAQGQGLSVALGIAGGVLPDVFVGLYEVTRAPLFRLAHRVHFFFHNLISHRTGDIGFWPGIGVEAILLLAVWHWGV